MSLTQTAADKLTQILTGYHYSNYSTTHRCPDIERLKYLLSKVSGDQRYELLLSISDRVGDTVLRVAAGRGHRELCVTLLSSLPSADRLKLILVNMHTALHAAAYQDHTETVSGILSCLTAEQQLQLLFKQDSDGNTAFHQAALNGLTETAKNLLDNITPEQQLQLL